MRIHTKVAMSFGAIAAIAVAAAAPRLSAQSVRLLPAVQFGFTGITPDQTARLAITGVIVNGYPPGPCRATLAFVDAAGQTLLNTDGLPIEKQVTVAPGESAFLDLRVTDLGPRDASRRVDFRPVTLDDSGRGYPPGPCLPQLDIFDSETGSTLVTNPGMAVGGWGSNHNETLVRDTDR